MATDRSVIHTDGRLYCPNQGGVPGEPVYRTPMVSSEIVNHMTATYSWFRCWQLSATPGDKTIWYSTRGDENNEDGWMPEDKLNAPAAFKADPTAYGFERCDQE